MREGGTSNVLPVLKLLGFILILVLVHSTTASEPFPMKYQIQNFRYGSVRRVGSVRHPVLLPSESKASE